MDYQKQEERRKKHFRPGFSQPLKVASVLSFCIGFFFSNTHNLNSSLSKLLRVATLATPKYDFCFIQNISFHNKIQLPGILCLKCTLKCYFISDIKVIEPTSFTKLTGNTYVEVSQLFQVVVSQLIPSCY